MSIWKLLYFKIILIKKKKSFYKSKTKGKNKINLVGSVVELFSGEEIIRQELIPSEVFSLL
jgi:hypothetical protein